MQGSGTWPGRRLGKNHTLHTPKPKGAAAIHGGLDAASSSRTRRHGHGCMKYYIEDARWRPGLHFRTRRLRSAAESTSPGAEADKELTDNMKAAPGHKGVFRRFYLEAAPTPAKVAQHAGYVVLRISTIVPELSLFGTAGHRPLPPPARRLPSILQGRGPGCRNGRLDRPLTCHQPATAS